MKTIVLILFFPVIILGQSEEDAFFLLQVSETCQGESAVLLEGYLLDNPDEALPQGGVYRIETCVPEPCMDAIYFDTENEQYFFDATVPEGSYIISYIVGTPPFERKFITQFDLQAANAQILVLQNQVCQNEVLQIQINPIGGFLSGPGIISRMVNDDEFFFFDPATLPPDSSYNVSYNYSITASSGLVCSDVSELDIEVITSLEINLASDSIANCSLDHVPLDIEVVGDTTEMEIIWYNPEFDSIYNALDITLDTLTSSGFYYLQATNINGCGDLESVFMEILDLPEVECIKTKDVSCNNGSDGSLTVLNNNPDLDLTAEWSDGDRTFVRENLWSGTYEVTVTSVAGCSSTCSIIIAEPDSLDVKCSENLVTPTCYDGDDGTNVINITGGTAPYRTSLDDINYAEVTEINQLSSGNYKIYVLDVNDCKAECDFTIAETEPDSCSIEMMSAISCYNSFDGSLSVVGSGGLQSLLWSNGDTTAIVAGLTAGNYSVTVTSEVGCTSICVTELIEPEQLAIELVVAQNPICYGKDSGIIEFASTGGTLPYTYILNDSVIGSHAIVTGLKSGDYTIAVQDTNGCSSELQFSLEDPIQLEGVIEIASNILCHGESNGALSVKTSDNVHEILWSTGDTTEQITMLGTGQYSVTLTDVLGCEKILTQLLEQPPIFEIVKDSLVDNLCYGQAEGSITLDVSGGVGAYSYIWSHGADTPQIENLSAGSYNVFVADENNCLLSRTYLIAEPEDIAIDVISEQPSCYAKEDGSLTVSSNLANANYLWSTGEVTETITGVAGTYEVVVSSELGCEKKLSVELRQPEPLTLILANKEGLSCHDSADAFLELVIEGGTAPYQVIWADESTQLIRTKLTAGNYSVTITDAMNCFETATYQVDALERIKISEELTNPDCFGEATGSIVLSSEESLAEAVIEWSIPTAENVLQLDNLTAGSYSVLITFSDDCQQSYSYNLEDNPPLEITKIDVAQVDCYAQSSGSIAVSATGGTLPYTYMWNNGQSTSEITNLAASDYAVIVSDSLGCEVSSSEIIVRQNDQWSVELPDVTSCMDEPIPLSIAIYGKNVEDLDFEWSVLPNSLGIGNSVLKEQRLNTIIFDSFGIDHQGSITISCTITDQYGCTEVVTAEVSIQCCFDLALRKRVVGPSLVEKGEPVEFTIELFNQGTVSAYDIAVADFPAEDMIFLEEKNTAALTGNPYDWVLDKETIRTQLDSLTALSATELRIYFQIDEDTEDREFLNVAEIIDFSSFYRNLPCDEDDTLSEEPEETDDDIEDDSNGDVDNPKDDDQKDFEVVTVCPSFDHTLEMAVCGAPTFELLQDENFLAALDPEGDGDGDESDGDTGNKIISFHNNLSETISGQASTMQSLIGLEMLFARMETVQNCLIAIPLTLDINATPEIPPMEEEIVVTIGQELSLSVEILDSYNYQWQLKTPQGFTNLAGENSATLYLGAATIDHDNKSYRVLVTQENQAVTCTSSSAETVIRILPEVLVCNGKLNVSLDENCEVHLSASQLLQSAIGNEDLYKIQYFVVDNQYIPESELNNYLGQQVSYQVTSLINNSSCWGVLILEDKAAPTLDCPESLIVSCTDTTDFLSHLSFLQEDNCSEASLIISDDVPYSECSIENGLSFTSSRLVSIWAEDAFGNRTSRCDIRINYEALDTFSLLYPEHLQLENQDWDQNGNGYPDPEESGTITNQDGIPLTEQVMNQCNIRMLYEDVLYPLCGNSYMLLREWTVVDWCRQNVSSNLQFIKVLDTSGPVLDSLVMDSISYISAIACTATFVPEPVHATDWANISSFRLTQYRQNNADSIFVQQAIYRQDSIPILELETGMYRFDFEYFDYCGESAVGQYFLDLRKATFVSAICRKTLDVNLNPNTKISLWAEELDNHTLSFCDIELGHGIRLIPANAELISEPSIYKIADTEYYSTLEVDTEVDSIELVVFYKNQYSLCRTNLVNSTSRRSSDKNQTQLSERSISESINAYPNPFSNELFIAINVAERQKIQLDLYSLDGRNVFSKAFIVEQGEQQIRITEEQLISEGATYMLVVNGKSIEHTSKVIQLK